MKRLQIYTLTVALTVFTLLGASAHTNAEAGRFAEKIANNPSFYSTEFPEERMEFWTSISRAYAASLEHEKVLEKCLVCSRNIRS